MSVGFSGGDTNYTDDELEGDHAGSADDKNRTTTKTLDGVECEWGCQHINQGGNEGDQEGVLDRSE